MKNLRNLICALLFPFILGCDTNFPKERTLEDGVRVKILYPKEMHLTNTQNGREYLSAYDVSSFPPRFDSLIKGYALGTPLEKYDNSDALEKVYDRVMKGGKN